MFAIKPAILSTIVERLLTLVTLGNSTQLEPILNEYTQGKYNSVIVIISFPDSFESIFANAM